MAVGFFNPTNELGTPSTWVLQSRAPTTSINRAQGLGSDGDEIASKVYGGTENDTYTYRVFEESGSFDFTEFSAGSVKNGWHFDSVEIKYSPTDYPEITISAHKHSVCETGITSHGTSHRKSTPSITLPFGFGCPTTMKTQFGINDTSVAFSDFTYSIGVTHQDEVGCKGAYLASENRDASEQISFSLVGIPTTAPTLSGWDCTSSGKNNSNTTAETSTYTFEKHSATEAPPPPPGL